MNKVYGKITLYAPLRVYGKRTIVSYGFEEVGDGINATWYEIYFSHKVSTYPPMDDIKEAILSDINAQADEKILTGFVWEDKPVWLSSENQFNFKATYDLAVQIKGIACTSAVQVSILRPATISTMASRFVLFRVPNKIILYKI